MNIKKYLKENRWSISAVSKLLGIEYPYLILIVNGKRNPSCEIARKISDFTGGAVSIDELMCKIERLCPCCGRKIRSRYESPKTDEEKSGDAVIIEKISGQQYEKSPG